MRRGLTLDQIQVSLLFLNECIVMLTKKHRIHLCSNYLYLVIIGGRLAIYAE